MLRPVGIFFFFVHMLKYTVYIVAPPAWPTRSKGRLSPYRSTPTVGLLTGLLDPYTLTTPQLPQPQQQPRDYPHETNTKVAPTPFRLYCTETLPPPPPNPRRPAPAPATRTIPLHAITLAWVLVSVATRSTDFYFSASHLSSSMGAEAETLILCKVAMDSPRDSLVMIQTCLSDICHLRPCKRTGTDRGKKGGGGVEMEVDTGREGERGDDVFGSIGVPGL